MTRDADDRILNQCACGELVLPAVPRTGDDGSLDRAFAQRTAAVKADAVDGEIRTVDVEQADPSLADGHLTACAGRNLTDLGDGDEHRCSAPSSKPLALLAFDHRVALLDPLVPAAAQRTNVLNPARLKHERRTGARSLVLSGAVRDDRIP